MKKMINVTTVLAKLYFDTMRCLIFLLIKRVDSLIENNKTKDLTRRQKQIVNLLMQENSNNEIADFLGYSISTIKQEISKIYHELNVKNREELINYLSSFTTELERL